LYAAILNLSRSDAWNGCNFLTDNGDKNKKVALKYG
jgi:hypothetical protein